MDTRPLSIAVVRGARVAIVAVLCAVAAGISRAVASVIRAGGTIIADIEVMAAKLFGADVEGAGVAVIAR